jgi:regulatory protein
MSSPQADLKSRALRLLAAREHSRAELQRKLAQFEPSPGVLALVLDALQVKGFISDKRVLESVLHRRASKLGGARIKQELQARGLNAEAVTQAVSDLRTTELERAIQVWRKKFAGLHPDGLMSQSLTAAERSKQSRFLASRGFAADTIRRVLGVADEES